MCQNEKKKFSPRVIEALERNGYFRMTPEERKRKAKECWEQLFRTGIGDCKAGKESLNDGLA